ncbi:type I secretion system permease/ATPase [Cupriavidus gilardii]|uniref:type I secretion system permease/ATPase n=1 Tax=Cupriavidus gilardii TaxID=82541 RepID=UPI001EE54F62|nr:type I secretion system permease/ATPase [Cupriavidus gilardii]MCG5261053.1 type I secretion system permease/ATPase [Cupriavidus gilardii]MDF9431984.1 type I secretion system permease/ATPase [Cupriavidus gilardii]
MNDPTPLSALAQAEQAPARAAGDAAPADAALQPWIDAVSMAARQLNVQSSPEQLRNAAAWAEAGKQASESAIVELAASGGLAAQFVDLPAASLSPVMLPVLVPLGRQVGMVIAVINGVATLLLPLDGKPVERSMTLDTLSREASGRLLLVQARATRRGDRLDAYLRAAPASWLSGIFTTHWRTLLDLGLGSLFGNLLAVGTSLFAMQVWDRVVPARSLHTLWVLASGVALALALELLIRTARVSITDHFGKRVDMKLSAMFFARVLDIRNDARPRSPGTLIAQLRDLEQLRELLTSSTLGVLIDLPFVAAFLFIIWVLGGWLVAIPLAAIPLLILPGLLAQIPLARLSREGMAEAALRNAILMESIYRAEDIKSLQAEPRFRGLWDHANEVNGAIGLKQRFIAGLLVNVSQTVQQIAYVGVVIAGVYGILDGNLSFGAVLACSILTSRTIAPLAQIPAVLGRIQNARVGKKALDELLRLPVDHDPDKDTYHKPVLRGGYRFENVAFSFDAQEKPVLTIPQLRIVPGERIAILGRVGAGKSTLLRLAGGLATPTQGRIVLDDTPMALIDVADLRRDIGSVLQESSPFYGTLRDNLLIANPLATDEQLLRALRIACADQLLLNQPHGLDLRIRENGLGLSGGQKQVLILARTFLRDPQILLLDEPTASLDEGTELAVIERMRQWMGRRTLIVATHRYPVLSLVDRIIVVDRGRIVRDGPKDEVLAALKRTAAPRPAASQTSANPSAQASAQASTQPSAQPSSPASAHAAPAAE